MSQARFGDIIAFNYNGSGFSHVGIYLGNNRIVHALNPGQGIRVNHLSELVGLNIHYQAARH